MLGAPIVSFSKVTYLDDIYVTKNAVTTKASFGKMGAEPMLYSNLITACSSDPSVRIRRKTLSSAFFKDKIRDIVTSTKETTLKIFGEI
jgi:hypothetical protein